MSDYRNYKQPAPGSPPPSGIPIPPKAQPPRAAAPGSRNDASSSRKSRGFKRVKGISVVLQLLFAVGFTLCFISLIGLLGGMGAAIRAALNGVFGASAIAVTAFGMLYCVIRLFGVKPKKLRAKTIVLAVVLTLVFLLFLQVITTVGIYNGLDDVSFGKYLSACYKNGARTSGGWLFAVVTFPLLNWVGSIVSCVILSVIFFGLVFWIISPYLFKDAQNAAQPEKLVKVVNQPEQTETEMFVDDFSRSRKGQKLEKRSIFDTKNSSSGFDLFNPNKEQEFDRDAKAPSKSTQKTYPEPVIPTEPKPAPAANRGYSSILDMPEEEVLSRFAKDTAEQSVGSEPITEDFGTDYGEDDYKPLNDAAINSVKDDGYTQITPSEEDEFDIDYRSVDTPESTVGKKPRVDDTDFTTIQPIFQKRPERRKTEPQPETDVSSSDSASLTRQPRREDSINEGNSTYKPYGSSETATNFDNSRNGGLDNASNRKNESDTLGTASEGGIAFDYDNGTEEVKTTPTQEESAPIAKKPDFVPRFSDDYFQKDIVFTAPTAADTDTSAQSFNSADGADKKNLQRESAQQTPLSSDNEPKSGLNTLADNSATDSTDHTAQRIKDEPRTTAPTFDAPVAEEPKPAPKIVPRAYTPPPLYLLKDYERAEDDEDYEATGERIVKALASFDINIQLLKYQVGPTFTLYVFTLGDGVSIKRVMSYEADIKRKLMTESEINIVESIDGLDAFGVEVVNRHRSIVGLKTMLEDPCFDKAGKLNFAIGVDVMGKMHYGDLLSMPHLLIAGSTNTGKSVCLHALICCFLYHYSPDEVRFIMIDPKMVELKLYNAIPHMILKSTVTDMNKAVNALIWAVNEMNRRFTVFSDESVRNIASYNELMVEMGKPKMPYIIIIVDELANLMAAAKRDVDEQIKQLTSLSRAAGIHMICATQRPSVDVITGTIKNNIPTRIGFKVASSADSKTIMDKGGAEKLYSRGDMFYLNSEIRGEPFRLQGPLIDEKEVRDVCNYVKEHNDFVFDEEATKTIFAEPAQENPNDGKTLTVPDNGDEEIFVDALRYVVDTQAVSITKLQRVFKLGYARAARLVDIMEERGFVTPQDSSKNRKVTLTAERFAELEAEGFKLSGGEE